MTPPSSAIAAPAHLHHQYFLGLQLMVAVEESKQTVYDWMFRLFRRQHEAKFLSSFDKLGLSHEPHAVACAKYHVLSNNMGGVGVEYMEESKTKAWVRFRYPRWMYAGPAICGIPVEASRGFLHGWYAQNGVSLSNPRLGFVCVSEDVTGQFGLCGYFQEYDRNLRDDERLQFAPDEAPPPFDPSAQPEPPPGEWNDIRLAKANRNYAAEYVRNGLQALSDTIGPDRTQLLASRAARLTGLQQFPALAEMIGARDGTLTDASAFLCQMMSGMGDECVETNASETSRTLEQSGLRIARGIDGEARTFLLTCWTDLWRGALHSTRDRFELHAHIESDRITWTISTV